MRKNFWLFVISEISGPGNVFLALHFLSLKEQYNITGLPIKHICAESRSKLPTFVSVTVHQSFQLRNINFTTHEPMSLHSHGFVFPFHQHIPLFHKNIKLPRNIF